jgi:hypothetical protein
MNRHLPMEDSPRVLAVTLVLWAGGVALAGFEGVFPKLAPVTFALLVAFSVTCAAASYGLDRGLRCVAQSTGLRTLLVAAVASDVVLVATATALARLDAPWIASAAQFPFVMSALFVAPLAVALHIAAAGRIAAARQYRSVMASRALEPVEAARRLAPIEPAAHLKSIDSAGRLACVEAAQCLSSRAPARSPGANPGAT